MSLPTFLIIYPNEKMKEETILITHYIRFYKINLSWCKSCYHLVSPQKNSSFTESLYPILDKV